MHLLPIGQMNSSKWSFLKRGQGPLSNCNILWILFFLRGKTSKLHSQKTPLNKVSAVLCTSDVFHDIVTHLCCMSTVTTGEAASPIWYPQVCCNLDFQKEVMLVKRSQIICRLLVSNDTDVMFKQHLSVSQFSFRQGWDIKKGNIAEVSRDVVKTFSSLSIINWTCLKTKHSQIISLKADFFSVFPSFFFLVGCRSKLDQPVSTVPVHAHLIDELITWLRTH